MSQIPPPATPFRNPIMRPKDVAAYLGVSVRMVINHEKDFGFERLKISCHRIYYRRADVEAAMSKITIPHDKV
jgi:predicted transcriptional regulator